MSNKWIWHSDDRYAESEEMWAVPGVLRYLTFNLRFKMTKFTAVFCVPSSPFPHACRFLPAHSAQGSLPPPYQWTGSQRLLVGREERPPAAHGRTRGGCRCGMVNVETGGFSHNYVGVCLKTSHLPVIDEGQDFQKTALLLHCFCVNSNRAT